MHTSSDLDCLFVHAPKAANHYLPIGDFFNITYLPMGLLAIAETLRRHQFRTEVVHLGVEWLVDPTANLLSELDGMHIRAIGLPLYWHYQSYDAIETARALKRAHPEAFVFLGGVTASYFAEEILATFPELDGILKGHAEGSTLALVQALTRGGDADLSRVPNLVMRTPQGIRTTGITPSAPPSPTVDDLVFADLSVLRHAETYVQSFGFPLAYSREFSRDENRAMLSMGRSFFPLFTGRGCPYSCTFCGGNRDTLKAINGTNRITWRSPDKVVEDIRRAMEYGYKTMSLCFDPTPSHDAYYLTLFEKIRASKLSCDFYFESWGLPTKQFILDFRRTFPSPESYIALSPDAGNERVRKLNKQPYYSDTEMFNCLDLLKETEILVDIFFTLALPGETLIEAMETAHLKRKIAQTYPNTRRVMTWTVQLEPGSPQFERPTSFGMQTDRSCFKHFYEAHRGNEADTYSSLGFKIDGYFGDARDEGGIAEFERELQHLKCMEFCFLAKDPRQWNAPEAGRRHCLERRQGLARRRGHAAPTLEIGPGIYYEDAMKEEVILRPPHSRPHWLPPVALQTEARVSAPDARHS